jgi:hypothetical protein
VCVCVCVYVHAERYKSTQPVYLIVCPKQQFLVVMVHIVGFSSCDGAVPFVR